MIIDNKINKEIVGIYLIDNDINGIKLATTKRPNIFRKFFIRLLLGWKWIKI